MKEKQGCQTRVKNATRIANNRSSLHPDDGEELDNDDRSSW